MTASFTLTELDRLIKQEGVEGAREIISEFAQAEKASKANKNLQSKSKQHDEKLYTFKHRNHQYQRCSP